MDDVKFPCDEPTFCELTGMSRVTAWRMRKAGKLSFYQIGSKISYGRKHVEEFLARCEQKAAEDAQECLA